MTSVTISREELYRMVWNQPLSKVSKNYQISDVGLRDLCIRNQIPLPRKGHWMRVKYGKADKSIPLKVIKNPKPVKLTLWNEDYEKNKNRRARMNSDLLELEIKLKEHLKPSKRLSSPHYLVTRSKEEFRKLNGSEFQQYKFILGLHSKECLNISVTRNQVIKSLQFYNSFINSIQEMGWEINAFHETSTFIQIDEVKIELHLRECYKRVKLENSKSLYHTHEYEPTGIISFNIAKNLISFGKQFKDATNSLESQIPKMILYILDTVEKEKENKNRIKQHRDEYELKRKKQEANNELKKLEIIKYKQLLAEAQRLEETRIINNYLTVLEESRNGENEWISWVRDKVNWVDPSVNKEDPILGKYRCLSELEKEIKSHLI